MKIVGVKIFEKLQSIQTVNPSSQKERKAKFFSAPITILLSTIGKN